MPLSDCHVLLEWPLIAFIVAINSPQVPSHWQVLLEIFCVENMFFTFCLSKAFLRYLSTINHTLSWWQKDPETRKKSLKAVRKLHAAANKKSISVHGPKAYMTQFDMVTTQWAFVGPAIILPEKLGFGIPSGFFTCVFVHQGRVKVTFTNPFSIYKHRQI